MRAITEEEIESALRGTAQRMEFSPGEQARLPNGQVTFVGSIVDAVIRIAAGVGPRDYGNVLDVATYNNVLAVAIGRSDRLHENPEIAEVDLNPVRCTTRGRVVLHPRLRIKPGAPSSAPRPGSTPWRSANARSRRRGH